MKENIHDIIKQFKTLLEFEDYVIDKSGVKCIEIINASFLVPNNVNTIFGTVNEDWNKREKEWYYSQSLNVYDIPGKVPEIWKQVATPEGLINSNYGWCIFSEENGNQYENCLQELINNKWSRRATMIYNRPNMWEDYNKGGMSDFICTYATQVFIREDEVDFVVYMRSNDAVHGFKGDLAWQRHIHEKITEDLKETYPGLKVGNLYWNAASLHIYERHFHLVK